MKKYILLIVLFLGIFPCFKHGKMEISTTLKVYADAFGEEDSGDPCDPASEAWDPYLCDQLLNNDPNDPNDPPPPPPSCDIYPGDPVTTNFTANGFDYTVTCIDYTDCNGVDYGQDCTRDSTASPCGLNSVSLSPYPATGVSGDYITLTAGPDIVGTPGVNYKFQAMNQFNQWEDIGNGPNPTCRYQLNDDGEADFQVIATVSCPNSTDEVTSSMAVVNDPSGCVAQVTLSATDNAGKPGDPVTFKADLGNVTSSISNIQYKFQVYFNNQWFDFSDFDTNNTLQYETPVVGMLTFRTEVKYICSGQPFDVFSNEQTYDASYCVDDFQSDYLSTMNTYWTNAKTFAQSNKDVLYETAFQVKWNGTAYSTVSISVPTQPCSASSEQFSMTWLEPNGPDPRVGASFVLAGFHTHPPVGNCTTESCSQPGPSYVDQTPPDAPFPMVVRTYSSGKDRNTAGKVIYCTPWPIDSDYQDYPFGNSCTTYYHN